MEQIIPLAMPVVMSIALIGICLVLSQIITGSLPPSLDVRPDKAGSEADAAKAGKQNSARN